MRRAFYKGISFACLALVSAMLLFSFMPRTASAYLDKTFSVDVKVLNNGDARITEKSVFFLESDAEKQAFDYYLHLGETTLLDWKRFSKNIGYHFTGPVSNLSIVAQREFEIHPNAASVTIEYDAQQIMRVNPIPPRFNKYTLNTGLIAFIAARGEISLGNSMSLTFELPPDAQQIVVSPDPGPNRQQNEITWTGPIFGRWDLEFVREESLSDEVNQFFAKTLNDLQKDYLWVLLILFAIIVIFKLVQNPE